MTLSYCDLRVVSWSGEMGYSLSCRRNYLLKLGKTYQTALQSTSQK
jgi:hypothetical protein